MTILLRVVISLMLVLIGLLAVYMSAYAFSMDGALRGVLQWVMIGLALIGVVFIWRGAWSGAVGAVGGIAAITAFILFLAR